MKIMYFFVFRKGDTRGIKAFEMLERCKAHSTNRETSKFLTKKSKDQSNVHNWEEYI